MNMALTKKYDEFLFGKFRKDDGCPDWDLFNQRCKAVHGITFALVMLGAPLVGSLCLKVGLTFPWAAVVMVLTGFGVYTPFLVTILTDLFWGCGIGMFGKWALRRLRHLRSVITKDLFDGKVRINRFKPRSYQSISEVTPQRVTMEFVSDQLGRNLGDGERIEIHHCRSEGNISASLFSLVSTISTQVNGSTRIKVRSQVIFLAFRFLPYKRCVEIQHAEVLDKGVLDNAIDPTHIIKVWWESLSRILSVGSLEARFLSPCHVEESAKRVSDHPRQVVA